MIPKEKQINALLIHHRPEIRQDLRRFLEEHFQIFEARWVGQALKLIKENPFHLVIAEASQGDFSSLAGIIPSEASLFLISSDQEELDRALRTWPENRPVEIQLWPAEAESNELFRRRLCQSLDFLSLKTSSNQPANFSSQNSWEELAREIKEIKGFLKQKVLQELENRLCWEIRCLLAEEEKQKIQTILRKIYAADDVSSLLDCVNDIKDIIKAQSVTFYILDQSEASGKFLKPLVFADAFLTHPDFARYYVPLSAEDFAAFVARAGQELNIIFPEKDSRFSARYREQLPQLLRSLLAIPIMHDREVIGVIEVYNKKRKEMSRPGFTPEDQRLLKAISEHISMAMTKLNLIQYDALTGLLRPEPFFEKILQKIHTQSKRRIDIGHCAMVMGDVDWFKNYNDLHGHEAGNRLLRELAIVLKTSIREEDLLCRYGGEEFLFFLYGVKNIEEACLLTERFRRNVEEHYFPYQEHQPRKNLTMSFGVTLLSQEKISPFLSRDVLKKLAAEADLALAEAKGKRQAVGEDQAREETPLKNRVCAYLRPEDAKKGWQIFDIYEPKNFIEKRRYPRHFISTFLLITDEAGIKVTKTINLSVGGAKICLTSDLPLDRPLNLTIILEDKACQLGGNIVYQEKAPDSPSLFHAGIEFTFPSPSMQKILEEYLFALVNKSSALN